MKVMIVYIKVTFLVISIAEKAEIRPFHHRGFRQEKGYPRLKYKIPF